jgi:hypothetical protein
MLNRMWFYKMCFARMCVVTGIVLKRFVYVTMSSTAVAKHTTKMSKRNKNDIGTHEKSFQPQENPSL